MSKNMGVVDRVIRILVAIVIGVLIFTDRIGGVLAIILGIVGAVFLLTSVVGSCPAYIPLKFSTRKKHSASS